MLQMRLAGDPQEIAAFLARLAATGVEVAPGTVKDRGAFSHGYSTIRMPDWPGTDAGRAPIRVAAVVDRPALPAAGRRGVGSRRRGSR
jgi:hypothetical protein